MNPTTTPGWQPYDEGTERYWDGEQWAGPARPVGGDPYLAEVQEIRRLVDKGVANLGWIAIAAVVWLILSILVPAALIASQGT